MKRSDFLIISWEKLEQDCFNLAKQIIEKRVELDHIVGIARGGLVIGRIMSDFLALPVSTFRIQSQQGDRQKAQAKVTEELSYNPQGKRILLVDEIVGHGKTLSRAIDYLAGKGSEYVYSLALYIKPHSNQTPEFFIQKTDKWVLFPYDTRETIHDIVEVLKKKNYSFDEIKMRLLAIGFDEEHLDYFLRILLSSSPAGKK